jgi:hypothetical protein
MTLTDAYLTTEKGGDIARGTVRLVYEMGGEQRVYYVPYDTQQTPDGLSLGLDCSPFDEVRCEFPDSDQTREETLTEQMYENASETLSHYYEEAIQGEGATDDGSVVFSGIVGSGDGWTPE